MFRTAKQRKEFCKECPVAKTANLLGDSFSILIVRDLLVKPRRFGDLASSLDGVSTRTLTNKLKMLEDERLIVRKQENRPPRVEYKLTRKGAAFNDVVEAMRSYGKRYL
jgi:DNA-binding HxlR family transcriptional regulator